MREDNLSFDITYMLSPPSVTVTTSAVFTIVLRCAEAQDPVGQGGGGTSSCQKTFFYMDFYLCGAI